MRVTCVRLATILFGLLCLLVNSDFSSGQEVKEEEDDDDGDKVRLHHHHHQQQPLKEEEKRLWGSPNNNPDSSSGGSSSEDASASAFASNTASNSESSASSGKKDNNGSTTTTTTTTGSGSSSYIPFVSKPGIHYQPPEGFTITSRVYTDPHDKLAHFDNESGIVFPYWECGMTGSTTVPIPLQHATVRHLLGGSQPNLYSGEEFGPHPQLVVALTSLEVLLNSGQKKNFQPGDVILLEDVLSGGHKLKGCENQNMTVMILTLSQHYHRVGKDKSSLQTIFAKNMNFKPCPTGLDLNLQEPPTLANKLARVLKRMRPRSIRRYLLTVVGLSISTLLGDFMGKVAPLWLAVVFGGGCFVSGGTYAIVKVGDYALDEVEMRKERRQLRLAAEEVVDDDDGKEDSKDGEMPTMPHSFDPHKEMS